MAFGSGLRAKDLVQGPPDLATRTLGMNLGLDWEHVGLGIDLQWLEGDGIAPAAATGQYPTHGEHLEGFLWGGSIDFLGFPSTETARPLVSVGLRHLTLHRRLRHDSIAIGQTIASWPLPTAEPGVTETSFDQAGFLVELSTGLRWRVGRSSLVDAKAGVLAGDPLGSSSLPQKGLGSRLQTSRQLDPFLRVGFLLDGTPSWIGWLATRFRPGGPNKPHILRPI